MSGPEHKLDDMLLEDFLAGKSDLNRAYARADAPLAPASLDDAVLDLARQVPILRTSRWKRLRAPIALAATVVLGLSVMLNIQRDPVAYEAASAPAAMSERMAMADAPVAAAPEPASAPLSKQKSRKKPVSVPAPKVEATQSVAQEMMEAGSMADAGAPRPHGVAASASPAAAMDSVRQREEAEVDYAPAMAARKMMAPQSATALQMGAEATADRESAEHWLMRIRMLRDAGKDEEARKLWAEYRLAYPTEAIPADLLRYEPVKPALK